MEGVLWVPCKVPKFTDYTSLHLHCPLTQHFPSISVSRLQTVLREMVVFLNSTARLEKIRANPYLSSSKNVNLVS